MPYTNIVTLHHNSERVGFVYILFYYYKQQRWRPIPRHYKIFCVNVKYGIQYGFRIFYLIALQNEENYEREESCSA